MIDAVTNFIKSKANAGPRTPSTRITPTAQRHPEVERREQRIGFTKVFRWPVPIEQAPHPMKVEVAGSFNEWRKVPMSYDPASRTWQLIMSNIESNRTHRYVILVDGKPSYDKTCDGLAAPQSAAEEKWQIATAKGPRVMLLFGQTK